MHKHACIKSTCVCAHSIWRFSLLNITGSFLQVPLIWPIDIPRTSYACLQTATQPKKSFVQIKIVLSKIQKIWKTKSSFVTHNNFIDRVINFQWRGKSKSSLWRQPYILIVQLKLTIRQIHIVCLVTSVVNSVHIIEMRRSTCTTTTTTIHLSEHSRRSLTRNEQWKII